jgi:IS30 family transposase
VANHLSVTKSNAIKKLHQQGQSQREIADALNVDRKTVRRHLAVDPASDRASNESKGTGAPTGSGDPGDSAKPTKSASVCEPFREAIEEKLGRGLHAQRIFQDLQIEHDFQGKYWSVRRFVKKLRTEKPTAFRRIEVQPGWEAQVDFGTGAPARRSSARTARSDERMSCEWC